MFWFSATQMGLRTTKFGDHISPIIKKTSRELCKVGVTHCQHPYVSGLVSAKSGQMLDPKFF